MNSLGGNTIKILKILLTLHLIVNCSPSFAGEDKIKIYPVKEKGRSETRYYADNLNFSPYQFNADFVVFENLKSDKEVPFVTILKARTKKQYLFTLRPARPGTSTRLGIKSSYSRGDPDATHNDDYIYLFPFEHGKKYVIGQGYDGSSTHQDRKALDFNMEIGTAVTAARDGIVVAVQENSRRGGMDSAYEKDGNHVVILHDDNTFAMYAHLEYNGSVVKVGDLVKAGAVIGYSGSTGLSSGPHLHFEVYKVAHRNEGRKNVSIPTRFLNYDGKAVVPEEGLSYYATHPGEGPYDVELGSDYKDEDFVNFIESVPTDNDFKIVEKIVDNTVLFFARNGFEKVKELTFEFSEITNMMPSKKLPYVQNIPANSKVYVMLLRPDRGAGRKGKRQYLYKYKVR